MNVRHTLATIVNALPSEAPLLKRCGCAQRKAKLLELLGRPDLAQPIRERLAAPPPTDAIIETTEW